MDDKIKSAYERAMERADALDAPTDEERLEWKWIPEGKKLAAIAMSGTTDVALEMSKVEEAGRNYVLKGLFDVLVENHGAGGSGGDRAAIGPADGKGGLETPGFEELEYR